MMARECIRITTAGALRTSQKAWAIRNRLAKGNNVFVADLAGA
jgi:hypothetical protein